MILKKNDCFVYFDGTVKTGHVPFLKKSIEMIIWKRFYKLDIIVFNTNVKQF